MGILAAILCSFTYVVAQIYGVGLITTRLTGRRFEVGVFLGLGGILVCSFLGGMRAVTWTQVAQYIILIVAYLIPVVWLSVKITGVPVPQVVYGKVLEKVTAREEELHQGSEGDPGRATSSSSVQPTRSAKLKDVDKSYAEGKAAAAAARDQGGGRQRRRRRSGRRQEGARGLSQGRGRGQGRVDEGRADSRHVPLRRCGMPRHSRARTTPARDVSRRNFLALVFCLMVGTAALPHILMRYYTTPSVRQARESVFWSLFFIFLLYFTAPALAVLAKFDVYTSSWARSSASYRSGWRRGSGSIHRCCRSSTSTGTASCSSAEIAIGGDIIVLATPEIARPAVRDFRAWSRQAVLPRRCRPRTACC